MMARQVARQFCCLGEAHSLVYGRRASGKNGRKLTANTRVGAERRLMDYPGLSVNPGGKVPTLVDGDLVLTESAAICTYIGDKFPQSGLVPPVTDPANRAHYLQWCFFAMTELEAPLWAMARHGRLYPEEKRVPAVIDTCKWEFERAAAVLTQHLQGREYAIGNSFR